MYLTKSLYQRLMATISGLQLTYAVYFALIGLDRIFQLSGTDWHTYVSALVQYMAPVNATMIIYLTGITQLVIAGFLVFPWLARYGAYLAFILLLALGIDIFLAGNGELYSRVAMYIVMAIGALSLAQLQTIHAGLRSY